MRIFLKSFYIFIVLATAVGVAEAQRFAIDTIASSPSIAQPYAIAFVPGNSGKFFFTEKNKGKVRIVENGLVINQPFATIPVTNSDEQGLLGITVHPQYPDSPFVYVFYTHATTRASIVRRFTDVGGVGVDPKTILSVVRLDNDTRQNGGSIHFGPDERLYVSVGGHVAIQHPQDITPGNPRGKILRLNADGSFPTDNPFPRRPFWSIGHRNSVDFTFDRGTGILYCTESGSEFLQEIFVVPARSNLGWPLKAQRSFKETGQYVKPILTLPRSDEGLAGIVVYRGNAFPRMRGKLLTTSLKSPVIRSFDLAEDGRSVVRASLDTLPIHGTGFSDIEVGPDGNIYLASGPFGASRIFRVHPVAPRFVSIAPDLVVQGQMFEYMPEFSGTPPTLSIVSGPDGATIDTTTWSIRWIPSNADAISGERKILLRGENGAGSDEQEITIHVSNVNDAPLDFALLNPAADTTLSFVGSIPNVTFAWEAAFDPDRDTIRYILQIDTSDSFDSPVLQEIVVGAANSYSLELPKGTKEYYWRVAGSDSEITVHSHESRKLHISFQELPQEKKTKPKEFDLEQNFPNPFNPMTTIVYTIPRAGFVRLSVFNLLGQQVALMYEGIQTAGRHSVDFNSSELTSGIYFYRIQAPGFMQSRKMVVTK